MHKQLTGNKPQYKRFVYLQFKKEQTTNGSLKHVHSDSQYIANGKLCSKTCMIWQQWTNITSQAAEHVIRLYRMEQQNICTEWRFRIANFRTEKMSYWYFDMNLSVHRILLFKNILFLIKYNFKIPSPSHFNLNSENSIIYLSMTN